MSENPQELVEAKLLAYVEGELDEADRADIERHLETNPKHRSLLADLQVGRKWVRGLRKESAPAELFDGVQSQLERHLLLDDASSTPSHSSAGNASPEHLRLPDEAMLKIRRWTRIRYAAAAAVVLGGVGLVVYSSLPQKSQSVAEAPGKVNSKSQGLTGSPEPEELKQSTKSGGGHSNGSALSSANTPMQPSGLSNLAGGARPPDSAEKRAVPGPVPPPLKPGFDRTLAKAIEPQESASLVAERARSAPAVREMLESLRGNRNATAGTLPAPGAPAIAAAPSATHQPTANELANSARDTRRQTEPFVLVIASTDPLSSRQQLDQLLAEQNLFFRRVDLDREPTLRKTSASADRPVELANPRPVAPARPTPAVAEAATPAAPSQVLPAPFPAGKPRLSSVPALPPLANTTAPAATPIPLPTGLTPIPASPASLPPGQDVIVLAGVPRSRATRIVAALSRPNPSQQLAFDELTSAPGSASSGRASQPAQALATNELQRQRQARSMDGLASGQPVPADRVPPAPPAVDAASRPSPSVPLAKSNPSADKDARAQAMRSAAPSGPADGDGATRPSGQTMARSAAPTPSVPFMPAAPAGGPAGAGEQAKDAGKVVPGEHLQLIYRSLRPNGPPIPMKVRVTDRGTIFVVGLGEVTIAGLSLDDATKLLTDGLKQKTPESLGAEVRRYPIDASSPKPGLAGGLGGAKVDGGGVGGGGVGAGGGGGRKDMGGPGSAMGSPGVKSEIAPLATDSNESTDTSKSLKADQRPTAKLADPADDELIDLVIVVQRTAEANPTDVPSTQP